MCFRYVDHTSNKSTKSHEAQPFRCEWSYYKTESYCERPIRDGKKSV